MDSSVRRFRLRFSLRSLLLITAILACGLGWLMHKINVCHAREEAIVALKKVGVGVQVENKFTRYPPSWLRYLFGEYVFFKPVCLYTLRTDTPPLCDLPLAQFSKIRSIIFSGSSRTADLLPLAAACPSLRTLGLDGTAVADVSPLANCQELVQLDLSRTKVKDLTPLTNCSRLETLGLKDTPVTEDQIENFRKALPNCVIQR